MMNVFSVRQLVKTNKIFTFIAFIDAIKLLLCMSACMGVGWGCFFLFHVKLGWEVWISRGDRNLSDWTWCDLQGNATVETDETRAK